MKEYIFGIDIGGTSIKFGLFKNGSLIEKWAVPTDVSDSGRNVAGDISRSIKGAMERYSLSAADIKGAGAGIPGAVHDGYLEPCVNLGGLCGFGIKSELEQKCGFRFTLLNDANAAGLGEMRQGSGRGYDNLYFVTLGTGVGGCLILNRRLVTGKHGCCGEIGHINMNNKETRDFGLKKPGCLEMYASASGVVLSAKTLLQESHASSCLRKLDEISCADVFACAKRGDALSLEAVNIMAEHLGRALAAISCVCNPDVFIIGGGVAAAGDFLISRIRGFFREYAFASSADTEIVLASLGNDAGIWGAFEAADNGIG